MTLKWEDVQIHIRRKYWEQGKTLEEVRIWLQNEYGFTASTRAFKNKIKEWKFEKNAPRNSLAAVPASLAQQINLDPSKPHDTATWFVKVIALPFEIIDLCRSLLLRSSPSIAKSALIYVDNELKRHLYDVGDQRRAFYSTRDRVSQASTDSNTQDLDRVVREVKKLEKMIIRMRQSTRNILSSVSEQSRDPAGFAAVWKLEPMILEDAHGNVLAIPLEVVVSWEVFDDILLNHFKRLAERKVPGTKKVQDREYVIEDSFTRVAFSRARSWDSFGQPGRRIDMSMVFKSHQNTQVICPKCNAVSDEQKEVFVECQNPHCKMQFRTEEDVDDSNTIKSSLRKGRVYSIQEQLHEAPAMFKRVIMRQLPCAPGSPMKACIESSSNIWTTIEDDDLLIARVKGLHWALIQKLHVPSKSASMCRLRHEFLTRRDPIVGLHRPKFQPLRQRRRLFSRLKNTFMERDRKTGAAFIPCPSTRRSTISGVRCPMCAANGQEVWVITGKSCTYCGTFS